jgi:hypothetical protein
MTLRRRILNKTDHIKLLVSQWPATPGGVKVKASPSFGSVLGVGPVKERGSAGGECVGKHVLG